MRGRHSIQATAALHKRTQRMQSLRRREAEPQARLSGGLLSAPRWHRCAGPRPQPRPGPSPPRTPRSGWRCPCRKWAGWPAAGGASGRAGGRQLDCTHSVHRQQQQQHSHRDTSAEARAQKHQRRSSAPGSTPRAPATPRASAARGTQRRARGSPLRRLRRQAGGRRAGDGQEMGRDG